MIATFLPALGSVTFPFCGSLEAVRIHGRHDVNSGVLEQVANVSIGFVVVEEMSNKVEKQFSSNGL